MRQTKRRSPIDGWIIEVSVEGTDAETVKRISDFAMAMGILKVGELVEVVEKKPRVKKPCGCNGS